MEKNDFYELLDGIIECSEKVAKLGRLLRDFVPQFMELIPERPIEGKSLIGKYGASRLSDINESDYAAIMKELEVIG